MLLEGNFSFSAVSSPSPEPKLLDPKSKMVPCKYSMSETSTNSSPFSRPTGLEATPKRTGTRKVVSLSAASSIVREESVYTEITDHSAKRSSSIVEAITSVKTSLRVRVINQVSNLFKDILVEIRTDLNLFDAIYDKKAVKKANIRKWGSAVTKQVKSGSHEIQCSVWDDEVDSPCHTYSITDMKNTSTRELYNLVGPESDLIKIKLQCVEKKSVDAHSTSVTAPQTLYSRSSLENSTFAFGSIYTSSSDDAKGSGPRSKTRRTDTRFSGVAADESVGHQFRDRDSSCRSRHSNYSHPCADTVSDLDENDNSTIRTTKSLGQSLGQSVLESKSTMRVKISNESSKRFKDLVVDIKSDLNVHESIYDHKCVKSAQVRKWTSDVVRDVKKKVREVQCVVLDGSPEENVYAAYSINDLKGLSTKDLFDLVPKSDPVQLVLRCVEKQVKSDLMSRITAVSRDSRHSASASSKRSSRPNHMNLSALTLNGSFSSFGDSSGSKNFSIAETNASFYSDDKVLTKPSCLRSRSTPKYCSDFPSTDNAFSLDQMKTEFNDLKSASAKQPISTLHEDGPQSNSDGATHGDTDSDVPMSQQASRTSMSSIDQGKLSEFKRLCRSKKGREFQSGDKLDIMAMTAINKQKRRSSADSRNASFRSSVSELRNASFRASNPDIGNTSLKISTFDMRDESFKNQPSEDSFNTSAVDNKRNSSIKTTESDTTMSLGNQSDTSNSKHLTPKTPKLSGSDKISRFLEFSAKRKMPEGLGDDNVPMTNLTRGNSQKSIGSLIPPIAEIEVFKGSGDVSEKVVQPSIPMSGDLVKQVFPYHIVIDEEFFIIQVGNSLCQLMENQFLIGKCISDIFTITGPIPSFGKQWDWKALDKMKEKTIFLEGLNSNSFLQKPKIKGSIIELSKEPKRQVLLALSPNVKNLSELEAMNLSMTDLPLHSCQRDAVLLGEHSKSEVKLTNHLDQLHRDLIDSMEKQIEDRTNELATANTNLEVANSQLAVQSAKQLEHFACMSHEIRTPLNCIVGMSSLLLEDSEGPSMDPMHADSIRMINTSGELLRAVVDDVLDYAKLESGSFEVDIKPTKLQDTLDSVLYSISQKVQDKNIRVRTHFSPTVPGYIETDSRRLQQVLFNLLGNAGKFSKPNSVIDLSITLVKASSSNDRDLIRFSVRDYGKGIEKKDFETIFQPFSQASKETQNIYGGTGLGLSITSKLVQRLGGTISLDSEYGKFTDFTVDLPMNGKYIEVQKVSNSLKNTTVVFIEPKQTHGNSFQSAPFKEEPVPLDSGVVDIFGLNVIRCHSIDELKDKISAGNETRSRQHFSLLVHETLHKFCSPGKLDLVLGQAQYSLITYGANFLVEKTKAWHLKSLTALFPVTLLEAILKQMSEHENLKNKAKGSPKSNGSGTAAKSKTTSMSNGKTDQSDFRKNMKVLYAEDNLVNQKVLSRVLQRSGIKDITIVDNGKKAVDISATVKYDCILLDMQMPVMDGMEACKIIMERDPDTIIVFVTAHALDEFKVKAKAAGAKGFISKPFRVGDIDTVLKEIYDK